jgi:hypothetical protein
MRIDRRRRGPCRRRPPAGAVLARTALAGVALLSVMWAGVDGRSPDTAATAGARSAPAAPAVSDITTLNYPNPAFITIPAIGAASPYPSAISVGALPFPLEVVNVRVTLWSFDHAHPDDVDVLLVGPGGRSVVLMSDVGGSADVANLTLTFDDNAAAFLPDESQLTSGTYRPTNIGIGDPFPAPAPAAGPWSLSTFNGRNPVGTWNLFIVDDGNGLAGDVSGGWTIHFTVTNNPRFDVAVDFGNPGLWTFYNNGSPGWIQRHNLSPTVLTSGDLDGNGQMDLVANFQGFGLFAFMNDATWVHLHPFNATDVETGDLNGNGKADLVINFPGIGVWVRYDSGTWMHLHPFNATAIATGNINNDGGNRADVVLHFPGYGLWAYYDNTAFAQLHPATVLDVQTGDLNGNEVPDLIVSFQGQGVWVRYDNGTWAQLHPLNPTTMVLGNLDGDGGSRSELVVNFPGFGVWVWLNNGSWVQIHGLQAPVMAAGDVDSDGRPDVILHFPGLGIWVVRNLVLWSQIHPSAPELMAAGRFDGT